MGVKPTYLPSAPADTPHYESGKSCISSDRLNDYLTRYDVGDYRAFCQGLLSLDATDSYGYMFLRERVLTIANSKEELPYLYHVPILKGFALLAHSTSSDFLNHALEVNFPQLLQAEPSLMKATLDDYHLRAAIASAVAVNPDCVDPNRNKKDYHCFPSHLLKRYNWLLNHPFPHNRHKSLPIHALYHIADTWMAENEPEWALRHAGVTFDMPVDQIARLGCNSVPYRAKNADGVSVHKGHAYYGFKDVDMPLLKEVGGVCGAVSKYASKLCQAHGIPAMPVAQPGHCAMVYRDPDSQLWHRDNCMSTWSKTTYHKQIFTPWYHRINSVVTLNCMEKALENDYAIEQYLRSEILLHIASLQDGPPSLDFAIMALTECIWNVEAWYQVGKRQKTISLPHPRAFSDGNSGLSAYIFGASQERDVLLGAPVTVLQGEECSNFKPSNLTNGKTSEFASKSDHCIVSIQLSDPVTITRFSLKYWGKGSAHSMKIYAVTNDGSSKERKILLATEADQSPTPTSLNADTTIHLSEPITLDDRIVIELRNGRGDGFGKGYKHGIRMFRAWGVTHFSYDTLAFPGDGHHDRVDLPSTWLITGVNVQSSHSRFDANEIMEALELVDSGGMVFSPTIGRCSQQDDHKHRRSTYNLIFKECIPTQSIAYRSSQCSLLSIQGVPIGADPIRSIHAILLNYVTTNLCPENEWQLDFLDCVQSLHQM